jgi:hypothetical protein
VHTELAQYVNNMPFFQQGAPPSDENADPNVCQPATEQANSALTAIELKDIFKSMMSEFKNVNRRGGRKTATVIHCPQHKELILMATRPHTARLMESQPISVTMAKGHKEEATMQNKMGGSTELVKNNRRNNNN